MNKGVTVWLTGLSAAGKSTLAQALEEVIRRDGRRVEVLDGDAIRTNLSKGLTFSREDRETNLRRIGFVCKLLARNGVIVIVAAIAPYESVRAAIRRDIGDYVEVFVDCPLEVCSERDPKGLYTKALKGEIKQFTGVSDPYDAPSRPEVRVRTDRESVEESRDKILAALADRGYLGRAEPLASVRAGGSLGGSTGGLK